MFSIPQNSLLQTVRQKCKNLEVGVFDDLKMVHKFRGINSKLGSFSVCKNVFFFLVFPSYLLSKFAVRRGANEKTKI